MRPIPQECVYPYPTMRGGMEVARRAATKPEVLRVSRAQKITASHREAFALAANYTRAGLQDAIDLILIHNEVSVRGDQPRTTLNPLIAMLSVAAWERFVADIAAIARLEPVGDPPIPGMSNSSGHSSSAPTRAAACQLR